MRVERVGPDAWARIRALRLAALGEAPDAFATTLEEELRHDDETRWRRGIETLATFVASVGEEDAGMARGVRHDADPDDALLISLWVAPAHRGRGVAARLVRTVADWARESGFARLTLEVGDDNAAARALYARAGFLPTGERGTLPPPRAHVREHRLAMTLRENRFRTSDSPAGSPPASLRTVRSPDRS